MASLGSRLPPAPLLEQRAMTGARIRFRDLTVPPQLRATLLAAVDRVLASGQLLMGPEVEAFEQRFAAACGRRYCVGVASGTSALYLALRALGIGKGDQVITTPMSWIATLNAIHLCGAEPVFVDITRQQVIDPVLIEARITARTRAILPVHFTGRLCDMARIKEIARKHGLLVIEDSAQAFGARSREGVPSGGFGDAAAFSLNPMKTFPGYGESGAIVTDSPEVYDKLMALRYLGTIEKEVCQYPELNHKIDEIQAAMMLVGFDQMEANLAATFRQVDLYNHLLRDVAEVPEVDGKTSVFFDYQIMVPRRDELRAHLAEQGIETKVKHPLLMDEHPAYAHLPRYQLPVARDIVRRMISLPLHQHLTRADQEEVADRIRAFYGRA